MSLILKYEKAIEEIGTASPQKKEMTSCPKIPFRIYYVWNPVEVTGCEKVRVVLSFNYSLILILFLFLLSHPYFIAGPSA